MVMQCCGVPLCTGLKGFGPGGMPGSLMFPRTVALYRSKDPAAISETVGLGVYEGRTQSLAFGDPNGLALLVSGIMCNIDAHGIGRSTGAMLLPGDVTKHPQWKISTIALPLYTIRDRDFLIDDEGYRYMVAMNGWTVMGYVLFCIRLET